VIPIGYHWKQIKNFDFLQCLMLGNALEWAVLEISTVQIHLGQVIILGMPCSKGVTLHIN